MDENKEVTRASNKLKHAQELLRNAKRLIERRKRELKTLLEHKEN